MTALKPEGASLRHAALIRSTVLLGEDQSKTRAEGAEGAEGAGRVTFLSLRAATALEHSHLLSCCQMVIRFLAYPSPSLY